MGMYDDYLPDPPLACPVDGVTIEGTWQGKDGPCVLAELRQGQHVVGDYGTHGYTGPTMGAEDLPEDGQFEMYTSHGTEGDPHGHWLEARGATVHGRWVRSWVERVEAPLDGPVIWRAVGP